jgi:hypothetical protein
MQQIDFKKFPDASPPIDRRIPIGDDRTLSFTIYNEDGLELDENQEYVSGTCKDVSGYALTFIVRTSDTTSNAALITKTVGSGITISGSFNASNSLNTQRVEVVVEDTDTWSTDPEGQRLSPKTYRYALKRTDAGSETLLAYGDFVLFKTTARD